MQADKRAKLERVLSIYTKFLRGDTVSKLQEADRFGVNERSIQRDIEDIRCYLETEAESTGVINTIIYDRKEKGYRLEQTARMELSNAEILAICKILLDSRAFTKKEMDEMLEKLIQCCVPKGNQKLVYRLVRNEAFHYIEPHHKTAFTDKMWHIGQAIQNCNYIEIEYRRMKDKALVSRKVKPVAIMFSEYYFYMTAFIDDEETRQGFEVLDDSSPTIYRIDRIKKLKVLKEHFDIPYDSKFEEGEFRKRIQFMYGGKLQRVKFKYRGENVEAVLDRLPTAKILDEEDGVYTIAAEVFGKGIDMWLRSQGDNIQILQGDDSYGKKYN